MITVKLTFTFTFIITVLSLPLTLLLTGISKYILIYGISWISSFGWPDDDSLESKHVAVSVILCNKLLCLSETYVFV